MCANVIRRTDVSVVTMKMFISSVWLNSGVEVKNVSVKISSYFPSCLSPPLVWNPQKIPVKFVSFPSSSMAKMFFSTFTY